MDYVIAFCLIAIFGLWLIFLILSFVLDRTQNLKIQSLENEVKRLQKELKNLDKVLGIKINESKRKV